MTAKTAMATAVYGMRPVGGYGIRGWTVHCPCCGHLSRAYRNVTSAKTVAHAHRCPS